MFDRPAPATTSKRLADIFFYTLLCRQRSDEGFALDSPLEGNGFELSTPREIGGYFRGFVRVGPIDPPARRIIRTVVGLGEPIELLRQLKELPLTGE